jgi:Domain of unknown function (DUF4386)
VIPLGLVAPRVPLPAAVQRRKRVQGLTLVLVLFACLVNVPFTLLVRSFEYPEVLRQEPLEVLERFQAGGTTLVLTWYAYALVALGFLPVAWLVDRSLGPSRSAGPRLSLAAAVLASLLQALGLLRWVFVVPVLAEHALDPAASESQRSAALMVFEGLHQFLGVAVGEHLGQAFTALWTALVSLDLVRPGRLSRWLAGAGFAAALCLTLGLVEGFSTVLPIDPGLLAALTPLGFLFWSTWLAALGVFQRSWVNRPASGPSAPAGSYPSSV